MTMRKAIPLLAMAAWLLCAGCTLTHTTTMADVSMLEVPDRPYTQVGIVHTESWAPMIVYALKLWPANEKLVTEKAAKVAREQGGDAIIEAELYTETHMNVLCLFGWVEHHFSGQVIRYAREARP
jgi:hypothetical protein